VHAADTFFCEVHCQSASTPTSQREGSCQLKPIWPPATAPGEACLSAVFRNPLAPRIGEANVAFCASEFTPIEPPALMPA
jgi:hypothetical protein